MARNSQDMRAQTFKQKQAERNFQEFICMTPEELASRKPNPENPRIPIYFEDNMLQIIEMTNYDDATLMSENNILVLLENLDFARLNALKMSITERHQHFQSDIHTRTLNKALLKIEACFKNAILTNDPDCIHIFIQLANLKDLGFPRDIKNVFRTIEKSSAFMQTLEKMHNHFKDLNKTEKTNLSNYLKSIQKDIAPDKLKQFNAYITDLAPKGQPMNVIASHRTQAPGTKADSGLQPPKK
jgi:hypothetical protein